MSSKVDKSTPSSKSKHQSSSPKHKSKNSHSSSSRHSKYKSKYQTRRSKERKEKKRSSPSLQALLHEDSKKCKLPAKRNIRFEEDKKLVSSKYFSIADEPTAQALSEEQVAAIRKKVAQQMQSAFPAFCSSEEIKHKESLMEGLRRRQNEKEMETKLDEMSPSIDWFQPIEFEVEEKFVYGEESTEIAMHDKRMSTKLRCFYPTVDHIPSEPNFAIINNKYSVKQVQQIQLYLFTPQDKIQDFDQQQVKQEAVEVSVKHSINLKQPKKGILKKSHEQILKEKEEEEKKQQQIKEKQKREKEMLKEKKKKEKIAKENAKKLAPETLKRLMGVLQSSGTPTPEQQGELKQIMKSIHDQGIDTQSIIQHIKLLKETLLKSNSKKIRKEPMKYQQGIQQKYPLQMQSKFAQMNQNFSNKSKFFRNKKLQLFAQKQFMMQQTTQPNFVPTVQPQQQKFHLNFPLESQQLQQQQQNQQFASQDQEQQQQQQISFASDSKVQIEEDKRIDEQSQRSKSPSIPQQFPEQFEIQQQQFQQQQTSQQMHFQQQQQFGNYQQFGQQQNQFGKTFNKYRNNQNFVAQQINNQGNLIQGNQFQPNQGNQFGQTNQQRPFNKNYKRVPCTKFHSPQGCSFGERCNFIHDYNYAGVPSPNMYKYVNQKQIKSMAIQPQDQIFDQQPEQQQQPQQQQPQQQQPQLQQPQQQSSITAKNQQFSFQSNQFAPQTSEQLPQQFQQKQQNYQFQQYSQQQPFQQPQQFQANQKFFSKFQFSNEPAFQK